jgi:PAS domain S-box-containing protein
MITDRTAELKYVNPAWIRTYGYTREEALGKMPSLLRSGLHSQNFYRNMWQKIKTDGHWKGELINRAKDGTLIPAMLTVASFNFSKRNFSGYIGIAVDMSERKKLEAEILHQDRLASIGALASGLAHEMGTPLGVIRGRAEFLQMELNHTPRINNALDVVISQIDRISHLITTLLGFSRSSLDLNIKNNFLRVLVDEVALLLQDHLQRSNIKLVIDIGEDFVVKCDASRFQQILMNLLINSIHAIEETRDAKPHYIKLIGHAGRSTNNLYVTDTGCGIPPENMKRIFDPFFTTKDIGKGTGLGLAIVAKLANEMNCHITVESSVNVGSSFTLSFNR